MKKLSFTKMFVALALTLSVLVVGCKDTVDVAKSVVASTDSMSEIDLLERNSKIKFFRQTVDVFDESGKSKITLKIASASEDELKSYLLNTKISLKTFGTVEDFDKFATPSSPKVQVDDFSKISNSNSIGGIHVETLSKSLDAGAKFYVFTIKSINSISNSKNLRPNYNGQTTYYSSDNSNNGTARGGLSPFGTNCYVSFYVRNCWACSYQFNDAYNLWPPSETETWYYSYRGKLIFNWYEQDYWFFI